MSTPRVKIPVFIAPMARRVAPRVLETTSGRVTLKRLAVPEQMGQRVEVRDALAVKHQAEVLRCTGPPWPPVHRVRISQSLP